jgi:hypothetical protein
LVERGTTTTRRAGLAVVGALLAFCCVAVPASGLAGAARSHRSGSGLVGYPSFLPKDTLHVRSDAVLVGTARRPALTSEGDVVKVVTAHWSARVNVTGPQVPGEGLPYQAPATTCTWVVTIKGTRGSVPIAAADFDSIDSRGSVFHTYLVPGRPAPPSTLGAGRKVTFELRAGEPVGEGLMRWAPIGGHIVAKWDFVVEND